MTISKRSLCNLLLLLAYSASFAHPSWGIIMGKNGTLYIADVLHHGLGAIWKLDANGKVGLLKADYHCHALAQDGQGHVWAAGSISENPGIHSLIYWDEQERITEAFLTKDEQIFYPGPLSVDASSNAYFAVDGKVFQRKLDGTIRQYSDKKFEWINSLTTAVDGTTYVVDKGVGNGTLYCIDPDGKASWITDQLLARPAKIGFCRSAHDQRILGMTVDAEGSVYMAANCQAAILKVSGDKVTSFYESQEDWYPTGMVLDGDTSFIIEVKGATQGPRIIRRDARGQMEILANLGEVALGQ